MSTILFFDPYKISGCGVKSLSIKDMWNTDLFYTDLYHKHARNLIAFLGKKKEIVVLASIEEFDSCQTIL